MYEELKNNNKSKHRTTLHFRPLQNHAIRNRAHCQLSKPSVPLSAATDVQLTGSRRGERGVGLGAPGTPGAGRRAEGGSGGAGC